MTTGEAGPERQAVELLDGVSESIFAMAAPGMVRHGWSVFPQEREGRRMPGRMYGRAIKWQQEHDLVNRQPRPEALREWCQHLAGLNVANVFGPASGHTFAVDIDVTDAPMSRAVLALAEEIMGPTPFMRIGQAPKIALIYRHGPDEADVVPNTSRHFAETDAAGEVTKSGQGLEIIGRGKPLTFHGRHHRTGRYFSWIGDASPLLHGPERATLVTPAQVEAFLQAVDAKYRFHRGGSFAAAAETWNWSAEGIRVPAIKLTSGGMPWATDDEGLVVDGREAYLQHLVFNAVRGNFAELQLAKDAGPEGVSQFKSRVVQGVCERFAATAQRENSGRWSATGLVRETAAKTGHLLDKVLSGRMEIAPPAAPPAPVLVPPVAADDPELAFVAPRQRRRTAALGKVGSMNAASGVRGHLEEGPKDGPLLDIPEDRTDIATMVQDGLTRAFETFLAEVYSAPDQRLDGCRLHVLKAPTGAGKTSRAIRMIAEDPRTYEEHRWLNPETRALEQGRAPFVMLLPTYANIAELRTRALVLSLDGSLPDDRLREQAAALGLIAESELDAKLAELRRDALGLGLSTMVYSGKVRAGCLVADKVALAMAAGVGTAAFCEAMVRKTEPGQGGRQVPVGEAERIRCEHWDVCPAIAQRAQINQSHLVFLPHSFLALSIPEELEQVRAVIADERIHHLFLHTATFAASSLAIARKRPRLTADERAAELQADDLLAERDLAAGICLEALRLGTCPAEALLHWRPDGGGNAHVPGLGLVRSALRVCGSAIQRDGTLTPLTPIEAVREMCSRPTGRDLREEWQFWSIIDERIQARLKDRARDSTIEVMERDLQAEPPSLGHSARRDAMERNLARMRALPTRAHGAFDHRIQYLTDESVGGATSEVIRISWRTRPNWPGKPMLLLDASAAPPIIAKIWGLPERDIVVHDVVADPGRALNVKIVAVASRTFSNASLASSPEAANTERLKAAKELAKVRQALSTVSALHGEGRVVAGTSIILREVINRHWACPSNVDWCHFGAMRGLDGFKFHAAALSVGRMEPPVRTIDGLVAALTYDDPEPEAPFDRLGNGRNPEHPDQGLRLPMGEQRVRLRSGHIAVLPVPMFEGRWARLVQRQYREEELLQFVGRLRPVYRTGRTPVWYALSSVIPEELIVDEVIDLDDLLNRKQRLWDAVRRTDGIAEPGILAAVCSDLFATAALAEEAMRKANLPMAAEVVSREARGFVRLHWAAGGAEGYAYVRGSLPDPDGALRTALATHLGHAEVTLTRLHTPQPGHGALALPRPPDTVEERIGPAAMRPAREEAALDRAGEVLLRQAGRREGGGSTWTFKLGVESVTPGDMVALIAIDDFWQGRGGTADDRLLPLVALDEAAAEGEARPYEQLGATVRDGATIGA